MKPHISIIVPIYNVEKYLDACIQSLINQTLTNIEIILVDDGSTDSSSFICDKYKKIDTRIKVIHKKNEGLGMTRNAGLKVATGEFVAFLDADDFVDSQMYEYLYKFSKKHQLDTCYCGYFKYINNTAKPIEEGIVKNTIYLGRKDVDEFLFNMIGMPTSYPKESLINLCVWRAIYSLKIIKDNNIEFVSERLIASEDTHFHLSYLPLAERIAFLPKKLYYYRYNNVSISNSYPEWKYDAFIKSSEYAETQFQKYYSKDQYICSYKRYLYRNFKNIVRREILSEKTYRSKIKRLKQCRNEKVFEILFKEFAYKNLPIKQQIYYLLAQKRHFNIIIIFVKVLRN